MSHDALYDAAVAAFNAANVAYAAFIDGNGGVAPASPEHGGNAELYLQFQQVSQAAMNTCRVLNHVAREQRVRQQRSVSAMLSATIGVQP